GQKPLKVDRSTAHMCMIIGYNKDTGEIAVSDSWGDQFAERWILGTEAGQVSPGQFLVVGYCARCAGVAPRGGTWAR
ncbi:MAG: hypothetical protein ACKOQ9_05970, partial [Verrucomicrobiota bacterium]